MLITKNKRERMMGLLDRNSRQDYVPAAFFIHFDDNCRFGQAAVQKHLEYFKYTDMDFVKIQYERKFPPISTFKRPEDWKKMPLYKLDFYQPELEAIKGLVETLKKEALILVTLYSSFMCAGHTAGQPLLNAHLHENPNEVKKGLEIISESLLLFVSECIRLGVDGFYASTQGGEAGRFKDPRIFKDYIKPLDLVLMNEIDRSCIFNILHVCDYQLPYSDLTPFLDYPGQVVNCNPMLATGQIAWTQIAQMFDRPCMGGLDRHGVIVSGRAEEIEKTVQQLLDEAPRPFVVGADCTLPNDIRWENIRTAIAAAHKYPKS
jgi:uroporphyrinogen decarboxylase